MSHDHEPLNPIDQATRRRLARLGSVPVDTTRVETRLKQAMPMPAKHGHAGVYFRG